MSTQFARALLKSDSNNGYAGESDGVNSLLVISHIMMLLTVYVLWPVRERKPLVIIGIMWSFVFSSNYHLCYSFDVCLFTLKDNNRLLDYVFSPMILGILFTTFANPAIPANINARNRQRIKRSIKELMDNVTGLNFYILCLYVLHGYLYVYVGADPWTSIVVPLIGVAGVFIVHVYNYGKYGIAVRWKPLAGALFLEGLAYAAYWVGDDVGSISHTMWHVFSFIAMYIYVRFGPVVVPSDYTYYKIEPGALDRCCSCSKGG